MPQARDIIESLPLRAAPALSEIGSGMELKKCRKVWLYERRTQSGRTREGQIAGKETSKMVSSLVDLRSLNVP
jgi:hypothetical protein